MFPVFLVVYFYGDIACLLLISSLVSVLAGLKCEVQYVNLGYVAKNYFVHDNVVMVVGY